MENKIYRKDFTVQKNQSAKAVGCGTVEVLSTPIMIAFMENVAMESLKLPPDQTSVGIFLEVNHILPTAIGKKVEVVSEVIKIKGNTIDFTIKAFCDSKEIGNCIHKRVVLDTQAFMQKVTDSY